MLRETPIQVFSCEYFEFFKNTFFKEHLRTAAFLTQHWSFRYYDHIPIFLENPIHGAEYWRKIGKVNKLIDWKENKQFATKYRFFFNLSRNSNIQYIFLDIRIFLVFFHCIFIPHLFLAFYFVKWQQVSYRWIYIKLLNIELQVRHSLYFLRYCKTSNS